jgi:hypothetical protein
MAPTCSSKVGAVLDDQSFAEFKNYAGFARGKSGKNSYQRAKSENDKAIFGRIGP